MAARATGFASLLQTFPQTAGTGHRTFPVGRIQLLSEMYVLRGRRISTGLYEIWRSYGSSTGVDDSLFSDVAIINIIPITS